MFTENQIILIKHIAYPRFSLSFLSKYKFGIDSAGYCRLLQDTTAGYYCRMNPAVSFSILQYPAVVSCSSILQ